MRARLLRDARQWPDLQRTSEPAEGQPSVTSGALAKRRRAAWWDRQHDEGDDKCAERDDEDRGRKDLEAGWAHRAQG